MILFFGLLVSTGCTNPTQTEYLTEYDTVVVHDTVVVDTTEDNTRTISCRIKYKLYGGQQSQSLSIKTFKGTLLEIIQGQESSNSNFQKVILPNKALIFEFTESNVLKQDTLHPVIDQYIVYPR
jgi:hypothetical protein